jgi:predicted small metal-binding protein
MTERKSLDFGGAFRPRRRISCGDIPSESGCTVTISGTEDEVVRLAALHAVDAHGHQDTPELRERIRAMLRDESF